MGCVGVGSLADVDVDDGKCPGDSACSADKGVGADLVDEDEDVRGRLCSPESCCEAVRAINAPCTMTDVPDKGAVMGIGAPSRGALKSSAKTEVKADEGRSEFGPRLVDLAFL